MNLLRLYAIVFALLVLGSCYMLPAPELLRDEFGTGAMVGCMRTMVALKGERLTADEEKGVLRFCTFMTRDALRLYDEEKAPTPLPPVGEGI